MRYRRLSYRYTVITEQTLPLAAPWRGEVLRLMFGRAHWQPDADVCEARSTVDIAVDLAGVDEQDVEVQLFEDAVVVEGRRQLSMCAEGSVYQQAGIRQGPFRIALPLSAPVDPNGVEAWYDRGLLRITLRKKDAGSA